jgi:hypothetical protein
MNKIFALFYITFLFCSVSSISQKTTDYKNIIITQNLGVNGNISFLTSTNFTDTLTVDPLNFEGQININGKIFLTSNMISIGNDISNTFFTIKNLDTAPTGVSLFYIMIDLDSSGLFLIPITQEKLIFADSQNYRVQTLQTNTLTTNLIQSQLIGSNEKAIIIGNPTSSLTLQGRTLFLNAEQDMTTSGNNLVITSDIGTRDIHLEASENTVNDLTVKQNVYGISGVTINNQGEQNSLLVDSFFTTEYGSDNIINFSANAIKCIATSPESIEIIIGMANENNQIVLTNVSQQSTNDPANFLLLNNNNNTLSATVLIPSIENMISPIGLLSAPSVTIENLIQCGNSSSSLTLEGNIITVPNIITTIDLPVLKNCNVNSNDNEIKILDHQIEELLKKIIAKNSILEKNPKLKEKLNFFLKKRAKNE